MKKEWTLFLKVNYRISHPIGHDVGDLVLKGFVKLIHDRIRSSDILVRYGGEDFLILFPDT